MVWTEGLQLLGGNFYTSGVGNKRRFAEQINSIIMAERGNKVVNGCAPTVGALTDLTSAGNHLTIASGDVLIAGTHLNFVGGNVDLSGAHNALAVGESRYVLITIYNNASTATLRATSGGISTDGNQEPPETPEDELDVCIIYLTEADEVMDINQIGDWRIPTPDGIQLGDNNSINLGDDADLTIYHNGTNSVLYNITGALDMYALAGDIYMRTSGSFKIRDADDSYATLFNLDTTARTFEIGLSGYLITTTFNGDIYLSDGSVQIDSQEVIRFHDEMNDSLWDTTHVTRLFGKIPFYTADASGGGVGDLGYIAGINSGESSTTPTLDLIFVVGQTAAPTEVLRLNHNAIIMYGDVGIGAAPTFDFDIQKAADLELRLYATGTNHEAKITLQNESQDYGIFLHGTEDSFNIYDYTAGAHRFKMLTTGRSTFGGALTPVSLLDIQGDGETFTFHDTKTGDATYWSTTVANEYFGKVQAWTVDTSGGGAGVMAFIGFQNSNIAGVAPNSDIVFHTGDTSDVSEKLRIGSNGRIEASNYSAAINSQDEAVANYLPTANETKYYDGSAWVASEANSFTSSIMVVPNESALEFALLKMNKITLTVSEPTYTSGSTTDWECFWYYSIDAGSTWILGGTATKIITSETSTMNFDNTTVEIDGANVEDDVLITMKCIVTNYAAVASLNIDTWTSSYKVGLQTP